MTISYHDFPYVRTSLFLWGCTIVFWVIWSMTNHYKVEREMDQINSTYEKDLNSIQNVLKTEEEAKMLEKINEWDNTQKNEFQNIEKEKTDYREEGKSLKEEEKRLKETIKDLEKLIDKQQIELSRLGGEIQQGNIENNNLTNEITILQKKRK